MEAYQLLLVIVLAFQTVVGGLTKTSDEKPSAVKDYISQIVSELNYNHARDLQQLRDIIDLQQKRIKGLEGSTALCQSIISDLENRVVSLEAVIATNAVKEKEVDQSTLKSATNSTRISQEVNTKSKNVRSDNAETLNLSKKNLGNQRRLRRAVTESQVAFSASMSSHQDHLGQDQDVAFDHVITNIGNAYNGNHGTFIAPVAGVYVFYFSVHSPGTRADLVVNGAPIANLYIGNDQASQLAIVTLSQGDDVSVQNIQADKLIWGLGYSSFSGFLLYEGTDVSQIVG